MKAFKPSYLFPLVIAGLILGIAGGFVRLGYMNWNIPGTAAQHGVLMVGGFLGTLITLERAMVMKDRRWLFVSFLSGVSIPVLLLPGGDTVGRYLLFIASIGLLMMTYLQSLRHPAAYQYVMSIGAASWLLGNFTMMYTGFIPAAVPWWMGFLLFTIVGERLELSKFLPIPTYAKAVLYMLLGFFFLGMWLPFHNRGNWIMGGSVILIGAWLLRFDMANVAAKKEGLFKYIGIGLKVGYVWLILNGVILCFLELHPLFYDLYIHTFFLGFSFSMIWAHGPIMLPMVLGIQEKPYHPVLWIGWTLFQLSLIGRMLGSVLKMHEWRVWFGVFNGWNILGMFVLMGIILLIKVWYSRSRVKPNQSKKNKQDGSVNKITQDH